MVQLLQDLGRCPTRSTGEDCASKGCKSAKALDLPPVRVLELRTLPSHMGCAGVLQPCPSLGVEAAVMCTDEAPDKPISKPSSTSAWKRRVSKATAPSPPHTSRHFQPTWKLPPDPRARENASPRSELAVTPCPKSPLTYRTKSLGCISGFAQTLQLWPAM